jgi:hypothetical protein
VHLVGYSHVKYTHSAQMSRSQDDWASTGHKRLAAGHIVFMRSYVARYLYDSHSKARAEGPEHESVPGVSGRSNGLPRSEGRWGFSARKILLRENDTLSFLVRGFVRLPTGGDRESSTNHTAHWERRNRSKEERAYAILLTDNTRCNYNFIIGYNL